MSPEFELLTPRDARSPASATLACNAKIIIIKMFPLGCNIWALHTSAAPLAANQAKFPDVHSSIQVLTRPCASVPLQPARVQLATGRSGLDGIEVGEGREGMGRVMSIMSCFKCCLHKLCCQSGNSWIQHNKLKVRNLTIDTKNRL